MNSYLCDMKGMGVNSYLCDMKGRWGEFIPV